MPTDEEMDRANEEYVADGPQPMANVVDRNADLTKLVGIMAKQSKSFGPDVAVKAALVLGLNVGIRVGQNRGKK